MYMYMEICICICIYIYIYRYRQLKLIRSLWVGGLGVQWGAIALCCVVLCCVLCCVVCCVLCCVLCVVCCVLWVNDVLKGLLEQLGQCAKTLAKHHHLLHRCAPGARLARIWGDGGVETVTLEGLGQCVVCCVVCCVLCVV